MHVRSSARAVALALFASAVLAPLGAQGARGEGVGPGGTFPFATIFVSTGSSITSTDGINKYIGPGGFFAVSNDAIAYGGGVRGSWGRIVGGGEFSYTDYGEEGNPDNGRNIALKSRYYLAQAGYAWYAGRHLNVYPLLGVGVGSVTLTLSDRNGGGAPPAGKDPTFPDVVQHPDFSSDLTADYLLFEPAIGVDWLVLRSVADRFGVSVGARLGKRVAPNRATWKLDGAKVVGGPDAGPDGTFLRLTIGIGWR
ncbi:MAG: hypothetical protein ACYC3L_02590 [Gemmatimonadaceae bacterium]